MDTKCIQMDTKCIQMDTYWYIMYTNGYILIHNAYKCIHIYTKWIQIDTKWIQMDTYWYKNGIRQCIDFTVQSGLKLPSLYYSRTLRPRSRGCASLEKNASWVADGRLRIFPSCPCTPMGRGPSTRVDPADRCGCWPIPSSGGWICRTQHLAGCSPRVGDLPPWIASCASD